MLLFFSFPLRCNFGSDVRSRCLIVHICWSQWWKYSPSRCNHFLNAHSRSFTANVIEQNSRIIQNENFPPLSNSDFLWLSFLCRSPNRSSDGESKRLSSSLTESNPAAVSTVLASTRLSCDLMRRAKPSHSQKCVLRSLLLRLFAKSFSLNCDNDNGHQSTFRVAVFWDNVCVFVLEG